MLNVGNFFWISLALIALSVWHIPGCIFKLTWVYLAFGAAFCAFSPTWHETFAVPEIDNAVLTPLLRGEALIFYATWCGFAGYFVSCKRSLIPFLRGIGYAGFLYALLFGGTGRVPFLQNPALAGATFLLCLGFDTRIRAIAGLLTVLLLQSRTGILAWGVGMLTADPKDKKRWVGAGGLILLATVYARKIGDGQRWLMWERWWDLISHFTWVQWIFGVGPGSFNPWYEAWQSLDLNHGIRLIEQFHHAHNDLLEMIFMFGILGTGLVLASCWIVFSKSTSDHRPRLLALTVVALTYFPLHYPPALIIAMILVKEAWDSRPEQTLVPMAR